MSPYRLPLALLTFIGIVALAPVWMHYIGTATSLKPADQLLAGLTLPAFALLYLASWLNPG
jgi:hypothetical protein